MLTQPGTTRPEYFHRYRLTPWAIKESYGITLTAPDGKPVDLITPDGRGFVRSNLERASGGTIRAQVERLFNMTPGLSHRSIARKLGCDHKTVAYHVKRLAMPRLLKVA
ncbi:helix-turn-helix domain-containing protein [Mesorhizobium sp. CGMCC 1.15528]|uniref:Helix-turn-helix domain-containing protein n=1 Tax=Mesorhizobium zhangyense TaxID=1776730 RepID=A0A7C9VB88_9HYPH|nr:helix-turn-helix domain-containing protein [Mesorhizobium zhangyense]NGN40268.1 helix-turn-helix domain-containing protein [Mesorhizobium zhangyense]